MIYTSKCMIPTLNSIQSILIRSHKPAYRTG